jgi:predicted nucleotidyltransferase
MESLNKVISSFKLNSTLQPKIWVDGGSRMNPNVRKNLLEIAYQFIDSFGVDVIVSDIIVVGSIANYNWSEYSDVDLHILVEYNQFSNKLKDMYVEYFDLKKIVFNQKRDIKMFGYDVEVFVEDADMKGVSGGVYSILNDEWITKPTKEKMKVSDEEITNNAKKWMRIIDNLIKHLEGESIEEINNNIKVIKNKLKKYRVSGLNKSGELGLENLVFKVLRRNGYIEKLYNIPTKVIDKKLSLAEKEKN